MHTYIGLAAKGQKQSHESNSHDHNRNSGEFRGGFLLLAPEARTAARGGEHVSVNRGDDRGPARGYIDARPPGQPDNRCAVQGPRGLLGVDRERQHT